MGTNTDITDVMYTLRDIKNNLKMMEQHDIKNIYNNSWAIRGNVDDILTYSKNNHGLIESIQHDLAVINANIKSTAEVGDRVNDKLFRILEGISNNITKEGNNEQLKNIIKDKLQHLGQDDSEDRFKEKMVELEVLVKNIK